VAVKWTNSASDKAKRASLSLLIASGEAALTTCGREGVALNRAKTKACFSSEAKAKSLCVSSEAISQASSGGARIASNNEVNTLCASSEAQASASEANKALLTKATSSGEAKAHGEFKPASPMAKQTTFKKVKSKTFQPKGVILQSFRVSMLDRLGPINTDLRDYLSNKRKLRCEEPIHIFSFKCGQAGCQLVTVHSVKCCLNPHNIYSKPTIGF